MLTTAVKCKVAVHVTATLSRLLSSPANTRFRHVACDRDVGRKGGLRFRREG